MTRIIKFRGKAKYIFDGEWVFGFLYEQAGKSFIHNGKKWIEVDPATIGQFTGIHDKNGKEIYEGDIMTMYRTPEKRRTSVKVRHVVTCNNVTSWDFKSLAIEVLNFCMLGLSDFDSYRFEVIGNVHDSPELAQPMSLDLPERKPRKPVKRRGSLVVEFVVNDKPNRKPRVERPDKHSATIVMEVTQEEMNKAVDKAINTENQYQEG